MDTTHDILEKDEYTLLASCFFNITRKHHPWTKKHLKPIYKDIPLERKKENM